MNNPYSVLLLYPDPTEIETYFAYVRATGPEQALAVARQQATNDNEGAIQPEDFACLAVISGHVELELDARDGV